MRILVLLLLLPVAQGCSLVAENFDEADWGDGIYTYFRGSPVVIDPQTMAMEDREFAVFERMDVSDMVLRSGQDGLGADCSGVPYVEFMNRDLQVVKRFENHSAPIVAQENYGFRAGDEYVVVDAAGKELRREMIPAGYDDWRIAAALVGDEILLLNAHGDLVWLANGVKAQLNGSEYGALQDQQPALAVNPHGDIAILQGDRDGNRMWLMQDDVLTRVIELPGADGWDVELEWFDGWLIRSYGIALHVGDQVRHMPPNSVMMQSFPGLPTQSDPGTIKSMTTNGQQAALFVERESGQDEMYMFGPDMQEDGVWKYELDAVAQATGGEGTWTYHALSKGEATSVLDIHWTTLEGEPIIPNEQEETTPAWTPFILLAVLATAWTTRRLSPTQS